MISFYWMRDEKDEGYLGGSLDWIDRRNITHILVFEIWWNFVSILSLSHSPSSHMFSYFILNVTPHKSHTQTHK
jgi:hypothetical protein